MTEKKPRPKEVVFAVWAIVISQLVTAVELSLDKYGIGHSGIDQYGANAFLVEAISFGVFLLLPLLMYFRQNWARIIYLIISGILLLISIPGSLIMYKDSRLNAIMTLVELAFIGIAFVLLVTKSSAGWFNNVKEESPDTPPWFR